MDEFGLPQAKDPPRASSRAVALCVHAALWIVAAWLFVTAVPRFGTIFADFGLTLPGPTAALIRLSRALVSDPLPALGFIAAILFVEYAILVRSDEPGRAGRTQAWRAVFLLIPLGLIFVTSLAMALALVGLVSRLSG